MLSSVSEVYISTLYMNKKQYMQCTPSTKLSEDQIDTTEVQCDIGAAVRHLDSTSISGKISRKCCANTVALGRPISARVATACLLSDESVTYRAHAGIERFGMDLKGQCCATLLGNDQKVE
jgi:hypothetical protein